MPKYHELAELAPRDVVARAITHELASGAKRPDAAVYLDLTHLDADRVRKRFPTIYATCMRYNIDIAADQPCRTPGRALRDGWRSHRLVGADFAARSVRRRRSCLHRRSWSESPGQQFATRGFGVRSTARPKACASTQPA